MISVWLTEWLRLGIAAMALWVGPTSVNLASAQEAVDPEARLEELDLVLPEAPQPVANYVEAVRTGNLVFLAGHGLCDISGTSLSRA